MGRTVWARGFRTVNSRRYCLSAAKQRGLVSRTCGRVESPIGGARVSLVYRSTIPATLAFELSTSSKSACEPRALHSGARASQSTSEAMALRELPLRTAAVLSKDVRPAIRLAQPVFRRCASSEAVREVESSSFLEAPPPPSELVKDYDPVARSKLRRRGKRELPPSR